MSQEKVDLKKDQKQNRKKLVRKKKIEYVVSVVIASVIAIAIVGWIGYSIYTKAAENAAANVEYEYNEVTTQPISDYLNGVAE